MAIGTFRAIVVRQRDVICESNARNIGHIDRCRSPGLTLITFPRQFGALKTQALAQFQVTTSSICQTSLKKVQ